MKYFFVVKSPVTGMYLSPGDMFEVLAEAILYTSYQEAEKRIALLLNGDFKRSMFQIEKIYGNL